MRYIILKQNVSKEELYERMKYIHDVFNVYTIVDMANSNDNIKILKSIPEDTLDLLFIIGHNLSTDEYLMQHHKQIKENNIVVIACNTSKFLSFKFLKKKNIYVPNCKDIVLFHVGTRYGFEFDVTDEEILLYRNRKEKLEYLLEQSFNKL